MSRVCAGDYLVGAGCFRVEEALIAATWVACLSIRRRWYAVLTASIVPPTLLPCLAGDVIGRDRDLRCRYLRSAPAAVGEGGDGIGIVVASAGHAGTPAGKGAADPAVGEHLAEGLLV